MLNDVAPAPARASVTAVLEPYAVLVPKRTVSLVSVRFAVTAPLTVADSGPVTVAALARIGGADSYAPASQPALAVG